MKIAVTSQNFLTITQHAGRTRRFLVYDAEPGREPVEIERLNLPSGMAFHDLPDAAAHPIDGVDVLICGSAGQRLLERMASRGIDAVPTTETDPIKAVKAYLSGTLARAPAHD